MASELRVDKIHNEGGDNDSGLDMSTNDVVAVRSDLPEDIKSKIYQLVVKLQNIYIKNIVKTTKNINLTLFMFFLFNTLHQVALP